MMKFLLSNLLIFVAHSAFCQCSGVVMTIVSNNPSCYQFTDGSATINISNGNGSEVFVISDTLGNPVNVGGSNAANNLGAGWYYIEVTDILGCVFIDSVQIVEPNELYFTELGAEPAYCRQFYYQSGNGVLYAAAGGGTPPYSYQWTNLGTMQTSNNATWGGLNPGSYGIYIQDNNGCALTQTVVLDSVNPVASFDVSSAQLNAVLFGYPPADVIFTNTSQYFANPNNPTADTVFFWKYGFAAEPWKLHQQFGSLGDTTYSSNGFYDATLVALNKNGCTDTLTRWIYIGLMDVEVEEIPYSIVTGKEGVTISFKSVPSTMIVDVFSINGQLIQSAMLNSGQNLIPLGVGSYILCIRRESSSEYLFSEKILVVH